MDLFRPPTGASMPAGHWLREARDQLASVGIESAALDARMLLIDGLGIPHSVFIADPQLMLEPGELLKLEAMLHRRLQHEPVSRILGWREFYGRRYVINEHVLDPRPDTETLVTAALAAMGKTETCRLLDIGTGTGCIAITLLAERQDWSGTATDISAQALRIAGTNAEKLRVSDRLELRETCWADGVEGPFDLIVSNPPYIAGAEIPGLMPEVAKYDPHTALDGGLDGLAAYRSIVESVPDLLAPGGLCVMEVGVAQAGALYELAENRGLTRFAALGLQVHDFADIERVVVLSHAG